MSCKTCGDTGFIHYEIEVVDGIVNRDMAIDAGDLSYEGYTITHKEEAIQPCPDCDLGEE